MKMTSAYANKLLKQLEEDKQYYLAKERDGSTYDAADGEEPVIPDYNYAEISAALSEIDRKMCNIKHALNISNCSARIEVGEEIMSVDQILVSMAQLNQRKFMLDELRKKNPKERLQLRTMPNSRNAVPEYRYINYDLELVKKDYELVNDRIMRLQIALDRFNQTQEFEVEI